MLPLRIRTIARERWRWERYSSSMSSTVSYSSQVRAYPFAFDEAEAARRASWGVALSCPSEFFRAAAAYFLGTQPVKPSRVAAVYLPGWIIDADVQVPIKPENERKWKTAVVHFKNSYMPGFVYHPLSYMSFMKDENFPFETVPWSSELANQHNMTITCLPFTMTPFSLVTAGRTQNYALNRVSPSNFKYKQRRLKQTFIAAYPVLMPVYLLQYENGRNTVDPDADVERELRDDFVIVHASTKSPGLVATGNILNNPTLAPFAKVAASDAKFIKRNGHTRFPLCYFDSVRLRPRLVSRWAKLDRLLIFPGGTVPERQVEEDLDNFASPPATWRKYMDYDSQLRKEATGSEAIDWTDPRIRAYSEEEVKAVEVYGAARDEYMLLRDMASTLAQINSETPTDGSPADSDTPSPRIDTTKLSPHFVAKFKEVLTLIERSKPDWVKSWESRHEEETEDDSNVSKEEREARAELDSEAQAKVLKEQARRAAQGTIPGKKP